RGVIGADQPLPHLGRIQRAFGPEHDLSRVRFQAGGEAETANRALGARAYTSGDRIASRSAPDLWLAAHEAAHVLQQAGSAGQPAFSGVGEAGDRHERQADAAANLVRQGRSAAHLFHSPARLGPARPRSDTSAGGQAVQFQKSFPNDAKSRNDLKHQARDDEYRRRQKRKRKRKPRKKAKKVEYVDVADQVMDYLLSDPKKRAEALATGGLESHEAEYEMTPEEELLMDLATRMEKVAEYQAYASKLVTYYQKSGKELPFGPVLDKMEGLTKGIGKNIAKLRRYAKQIGEARAFVKSTIDFVAITRALDVTSPRQLKRWIRSVRKLRAQAEPAIGWLKSTLYEGALSGAGHLARTLIVVNYLDAMFTIGTSGLENGLKAVERYINKKHRDIERLTRTGGRRKAPAPVPVPLEPTEWKSVAQRKREARSRDVANIIARAWARYEDDLKVATEVFNRKVFTRLWKRKYRKKIAGKLLEDRTKGDWGAEDLWLVVSSSGPVQAEDEILSFGGFPSRRLRRGRKPKEWSVSIGRTAEARAGRPHPYLKEVYWPELEKYLARNVKLPSVLSVPTP
ncbi:MAG: DUF4157 domain-containing protein, partial [bacterium]|nr:DUF4157 domain-containing protein [bacterium]